MWYVFLHLITYILNYPDTVSCYTYILLLIIWVLFYDR